MTSKEKGMKKGKGGKGKLFKGIKSNPIQRESIKRVN